MVLAPHLSHKVGWGARTTKMKLSRSCLVCGKLFFKNQNVSKKEWERRCKFCSRICGSNFRIGKPLLHLKNFQFKKGEPTWNKGLKKREKYKRPN